MSPNQIEFELNLFHNLRIRIPTQEEMVWILKSENILDAIKEKKEKKITHKKIPYSSEI